MELIFREGLTGMASFKKNIDNSYGLTLIETLASIVILSIVGLFLLNITFSSTKHGELQAKESFQINDTAYVLKQITKDLRKTSEVTTYSNEYKFKTSDGVLPIKYHYKNNILYRDNKIIANNIKEFKLETTNNKVHIYFIINGEKSATTISLRKGDF